MVLHGILISILGTVMSCLAGVAFATAPLEESTTRGIYGISRNPMYFAVFLMYVGIGMACGSWVFLLCAVIWTVSWHFGVPGEEHILIKKYGSAYREYMNRIPRWIGIPKSKKRD